MNSSAAGTPPPSLGQPVVSPSAMPYGISQSTGGPASSAFASAAVPSGIFGFPQQLHGVHPHGYYAIGTPPMAAASMYPSHLYQHQPHPGLMGSPGLFQPAPQPPYVTGGAYPYYGWPAAAPPPGLFYHPSAGVPPTASPAAAAMAPVPTTAGFGAGPTPPPHVIQTASTVEAPHRGGANGHTNGSSTGSSESKTGTPVSGNGQRSSTQQTRSSGGNTAADHHSSNGNASPNGHNNGHHRHGSSANGAVAPSRAGNGQQPSSATRHHAANGNGHGAAFDGNFDVSCSNRAIMENRQLVVKFLTDETNEKQFRELFERFGPVDNARIIYDRKTNHTKGFGFITYKHTEHAVQALRNMGGYQLHGRQLNVALAQTERKRAFSTEELVAPPPAAAPATAAGDGASGATEAMAGASAPGTAAALAASARPAGATTATLTTTATHRNRGVQAGPVRSPVGSSNNVTSGSSGADDDTAPTNGNSSNNSGGGVHHAGSTRGDAAQAEGKLNADAAAMPTPANGPTGTDTASTTDSSNRGSGHDGRNERGGDNDNDSGSSGRERLSSPPTVGAAAAASSQQGRAGERGSPATPATSDPAGTSSPKSSSTPPNPSTPTSEHNSL